MIIHVESPTKVRLLSGLTQERNREELFRVGTNPNGFDFDHYYDQEAFVINMQTAFKHWLSIGTFSDSKDKLAFWLFYFQKCTIWAKLMVVFGSMKQ